jgi:3-dehydroquinate synthase
MNMPPIKTIRVHADKADPYKIYLGHNIYSRLPALLEDLKVSKQIAVISVPPVSNLYLSKIFEPFGAEWQIITRDVKDGEQSKSGDVASSIYTWLIENGFERNGTIIAFGGGVVGDLAGFIAATYLRGTNLVHVPTSLLAQIDSSIGGKVGINHSLGKNLIGSFYQPKLVMTDVSVLQTLDMVEYICGLGEVVKYGILAGPSFFQLLEDNIAEILDRKPEIQEEIIEQCIRQKVEIVRQDTFETGIRSSLNLGHTFGHALETYFSYQELKHGQAVLLGILCSVQVSRLMRILQEGTERRIMNLISKIPVSLPGKLDDKEIDRLLDIMQRDKKVSDGKIHVIGIENIGKVQKGAVEKEILKKAFNILNEFAE